MADVQHEAVRGQDPGHKWMVAGFGTAAACYLMVVGAAAFTMGSRFIDNAFFAIMYGVFVTGVNLVPMLAWQKRPTDPDGRHRPPSIGLTMWLIGAYAAFHGIAYSRDRGADGGVLLLALFWAAASLAGMICMYFLGQQIWGRNDEAVRGSQEPPSGS